MQRSSATYESLAVPGGRYKSWKRRWFILNDNCLYYFEYTTDKEPRGIIPLENIQVREVQDRHKPHCFELYAAGSEFIKACKTDSEGKVVEGTPSRAGWELINARSSDPQCDERLPASGAVALDDRAARIINARFTGTLCAVPMLLETLMFVHLDLRNWRLECRRLRFGRWKFKYRLFRFIRGT